METYRYTASFAPRIGAPVLRNASVSFPPCVANGNYQLEVSLADDNRNLAIIKVDELTHQLKPSKLAFWG
jgi:hypothetical protein